MKISNDIARSEKLKFFKARAEDHKIGSDEDYEKHLYKVIVQHLNIFAENNWGNFEYLKWMAAVEYYEIKHNLPRKLSQLRFELEEKHVGFFISEDENNIEVADRLQRIEILKGNLPANYIAIESLSEYEFHTHKVIDERFGHFKEKDSKYNFGYWYDLVSLYELENNLPFRLGQLFSTERFVGFRKLRQGLS